MADRKEPPFYNDDSMGTFQYKLPFYESMELFIETLTGTCFQLRVSPFEAVVSVKAKIQRLEGIPVAQQHLIWNNLELDDDYCLHDYSIAEGCTLKLVLAMRGGPINTRRVTVEEPIKDVSELMEGTSSVREEGGGWERSLPSKQTTFREEGGWERTLPNNKQVTFLVYRDGDQLNFFRVVDRGDGTLTPLSQSLSGGSMYNVYPEEDDLVGGDSSAAAQHSLENNITMSKMKLLKAKMEDMNLNKKPKKSAKLKPRPPVSSQSHPCGGSLGPPPPTARHTHHHHRLFRGAALPLVNQPRHSSSSTQLPPIRDHHHHHEPAVEPPPPSSSNHLSVSTRRAPPFSFSSASSSSSCYMLQEEEASWGEEGVCPPVARPPPKVSRLDGGMGGGATRLMRDCVYPQLPPLATRGQHEGGPFQFDVAAESRGEALALGAGLLEERPPSSTSSPSPHHHHHGPPLFQDLLSSDPLNLDVCTSMQAEEEGVVGAPSLLGTLGATGETPGAPAASLLSACTLGGTIGPPPSSSPLPSSCASPCLPSRGLHHHHHHHHQQHFDFSPSPPAARPHVQAQQRPPTTLLSPGAVSPRPPTSSPPRPARLHCVKVESPGKRSEVICKSEARVITEMANQACKEPLGTLSNAQLLASLASARAAAAGHGEEDFRLGLALPSARASGPGIPSREEDFRLGLALPSARASGPGIPSREEDFRLGLALPSARASGPGIPSREEDFRLGLALPSARASGPGIPSSSSIRLQQEDLMITQMSPLHRGAAAAYNVASNSLGSAGGPNTSIRRLATPTYHLPPVKAPMGAKKKSSKHCFLCGKKTGLATSYECRCSHNFCATHRYAETHDCTYDYKSAGRRFLQESNPIITTPKLPKI